jgi:PLP dependent protein
MTSQAIKSSSNLINILNKVQSVAAKAVSVNISYKAPRLVVIPKTSKTNDDIQEAYESGVRHFAQKQIRELIKQSNCPKLALECPHINWHYIGNEFKNDSNIMFKMINMPNLFLIESVDSLATANTLNNIYNTDNNTKEPLKIMLQVNTTTNDNTTKQIGVEPDNLVRVYDEIMKKFKNLKLIGLMTPNTMAQKPTFDSLIEHNNCFRCLVACREEISEQLNINPQNIELSMGTTQNFENAISLGSTNIKVDTHTASLTNITNKHLDHSQTLMNSDKKNTNTTTNNYNSFIIRPKIKKPSDKCREEKSSSEIISLRNDFFYHNNYNTYLQ